MVLVRLTSAGIGTAVWTDSSMGIDQVSAGQAFDLLDFVHLGFTTISTW